ncbi:MAG: hypothetical protein KJ060_10045 [Candidatus Hydrogenedentes bacterium]|nr:hypothetical protein [Candidatus Hydrogenedentota bacterium]
MTRHLASLLVLVFVLSALTTGCARAKLNTAGFAITDTITVNKPLDETWQDTKAVLRELELDIYTRDKRGEFVAYTPMKRHLYIFTPHRTQLSIRMEEVTSNSTSVTIETVDQVYGVTPLTYPDWHDRKTSDNEEALAILESLRTRST